MTTDDGPLQNSSSRKTSNGFMLLAKVLGFGLLSVLVLAVLFIPAINNARHAARMTHASFRLKNVGFAVTQYTLAHGVFPQVVTVDRDGAPLNSWRISILSYIGEELLQQQWDTSQPWNSAANSQLHAPAPSMYRSPLHPDDEASFTHVFAVRHPNGIMSGDIVRLDDVTDGLRNTIVAVHLQSHAANWAAPNDITLAEFQQEINNASRQNPVFVVMADGTPQTITAPIAPSGVEAMVTRNGGDFYEFPP